MPDLGKATQREREREQTPRDTPNCEGTKYTKGLAATNKVAVGGAFLNDHVIEVGCMESGDITLDGKPILKTFPSTFSLPDVPDAKITYSTAGKLVDKATEMFDERHIVHMELPLGVRLTVLRWGNYVDFRLSMKPQPDQDGGCGNVWEPMGRQLGRFVLDVDPGIAL